MININGILVPSSQATIAITNRGYTYGDALFETIRYANGQLLFWEDHYFRLMAGMRILRMEIPMNFTPENLQEQILGCLNANAITAAVARVKITIHRDATGLYTPDSNTIGYTIAVKKIDSQVFYTISDETYEVALFKDHYVAPDLLSTLKTNNKIVNVLGSIYSKENNYQNCLLLNSDKKVLEALNGNLFLVKGTHIKTPPLLDGCLRGVLRKQLLQLIKKNESYTIEEASISPFELQKADELFITNVIQGIVPVTKFRKKNYVSEVSRRLLGQLNAAVRFS